MGLRSLVSKRLQSPFSLLFLILILLICYYTTKNVPIVYGGLHPSTQKIERSTRIASANSTLGFHSIKFINLPNRFDRLDAVRLQAYLSGIDVEEYPAVFPSQITPVGMPPSSNPKDLKPGEKGCWRAHANIWSEIVDKKLPPVLIIESDAAWDIDLRKIMALLNTQFANLLRQLHSKPLYMDNPDEFQANDDSENHRLSDGNPDDPWHSDHWDVLSLGHCYDSQKSATSYLKYADPYVLEGKDYFGQKLGQERVVHQSGGFACTTAYAVTRRGAAKLLLRTAFDFNVPVDLVIKHMIADGDLVAYTTIPTVIAQWRYVEGIGMGDRGANSDIQGTKNEPSAEHGWLSVGHKPDTSGWDEAKKTKNVWIGNPSHPDVAFKRMALQVAWDIIFSKERQIERTYP